MSIFLSGCISHREDPQEPAVHVSLSRNNFGLLLFFTMQHYSGLSGTHGLLMVTIRKRPYPDQQSLVQQDTRCRRVVPRPPKKTSKGEGANGRGGDNTGEQVVLPLILPYHHLM